MASTKLLYLSRHSFGSKFLQEIPVIDKFHNCVAFASTAVLFTHSGPTTQNEEISHPAHQETKETARKNSLKNQEQ